MSKKKKEARKAFRDSVFSRDNYTCMVCGQRYNKQDSDPSLKVINAHHIIDRNLMPGGGYVKENGITVCDENGKYPGEMSCHMIVEQWHITGGDESVVEEVNRPDSLYDKIGSSYDKAIKKSNKL